jgi:hypothetical protein
VPGAHDPGTPRVSHPPGAHDPSTPLVDHPPDIPRPCTSLVDPPSGAPRSMTPMDADPLGISRPGTPPVAPPFVALQTELTGVVQQDLQLVFNVTRARILVLLIDENIDGLIDAVVHVVLTVTGNNRETPLYLHFMGNQIPSEIKNPVLGEELVTAKGWISSLQSSPHPGLVALAPWLADTVKIAEQRELDWLTAEQTLKSFREVGPRKAFIDKANALRLSTFGALGDIAHSHPELNLPKDFAERFFKHERRNRKPPTAKDIALKVEAARAELAALETKLGEAQKAEAENAANEARARAAKNQKVFDKAQKNADDAAAKLATVRGELEQ